MIKNFRVLNIDGGGVKGIIPSLILVKLEQITGKHSTELFDLFVGTSTGAIICTVLNVPNNVEEEEKKWKYTAKDLLDVYVKEGSILFESSMWKRWSTIKGIYGPMYYTKNRDERFNAWLGDTKLKDTISDIVVTSYDMCSQSPVFFKSRKARIDENDNYSLQDVLKSATAAPTIFPPHILDKSLYIDALYGKNPTLFGLVESIKHYGASLDNIQILSLGTGFVDKQEESSKIVTSGLGFLMEVFNSTINASTMSTTYMMEQFLGGNSKMLRLDFPIPEEHLGICDVSKENIDFLVKTTEEYISKNEDVLIEFAKRLISESEWTPI